MEPDMLLTAEPTIYHLSDFAFYRTPNTNLYTPPNPALYFPPDKSDLYLPNQAKPFQDPRERENPPNKFPYHNQIYPAQPTARMSGDGRQRLRPWLHSKLDSGQIPGVLWKDRDEGIFQLPWKHGGKQDWSENDSLIFKEWAIHTGRFREGIDREDWSTWKTRLRCALNKLPDIEEMKEMSKLEEPHPYRVYRFLPLKPESLCPKKQTSKLENIPQPLTPASCSFTATPQNIPTTVTGQSLIRSISSQSEEMAMEVDVDPVRCGANPVRGCTTQPASELVVEEFVYPTDTSTGAPMGCFGQDVQPFSQTEGQLLHSHFKQLTIPEPPPDHAMHIRLRFQSTEVQAYHVFRREGCRLYYGPDNEGSSLLGETGIEIFGPSDVEQLKIPACPQRPDNSTHVELTNKLLNVLDRGLVLQVYNGDIYATRLCRCVIFAHSSSLTRHFGTTDPLRLKRDTTKEKIFDFNNHFLPDFQRYSMGQGPRPSPEVLLSFGQRWNPQTQDFRNLLISATVTHAKAHFMLQQVSGSSIPSLHISSENAYDAFVKEVKELSSVNWTDSPLGTPQPV